VAPEFTDAQLAAVADARYLMRRAFRMIDNEARRIGLEPLAFQALVQLMGAPTRTRTVGELATRLDVPAGLVSRLLRDLERLGYIGRLPSPEDGRVKLVRATATAEDLVFTVYARVRNKFDGLREDLDDDRRREALQVWADNFGVSLAGAEGNHKSSRRSLATACHPNVRREPARGCMQRGTKAGAVTISVPMLRGLAGGHGTASSTCPRTKVRYRTAAMAGRGTLVTAAARETVLGVT
jgi:DNA-binding MarR family transcriptional regulator